MASVSVSDLIDGIRHVKLILLLVKVGTLAAKKLILKCSTSDKKCIDDYLKDNEGKLNCALKKKQIDILFPGPSIPTNLECWDISLLSYILLNVFDDKLESDEKGAIKALREKRNELEHAAFTIMTEEQFSRVSCRLALVFVQLTRGLTTAEQDEINDTVKDILAIQVFHLAKQQLKSFEGSDEFVKNVITDISKSFKQNLRLAESVKYKYDVFISHKSGDDESVAHQVADALKKNLKVIAGWDPEAFPPGKTTLACIEQCVEQSWRTLVILTPQSIQSNWVLLELLQALEQSKNSNVLTLRLLLHGVPEQEIKFLKCGMLAEVPHFTLGSNNDSWPETLLENITNEVPLSSILSVGSGLAHGLVFSHYVGFLSHVLPVLDEQIAKSDIYTKKEHLVSKKYYLLLPGSCEILDNLVSYDPETDTGIEKCEDIKFVKEHAGKPRTFKLSIYKITKQSECFYFIADCPHVLKAICQLDELNKADKRFQIARFNYILNQVVNHAENIGCYDTVRLILYNEQAGKSMQTALFNCLKDDIPSQVIPSQVVQEFAPKKPEWTPPIQRLMSRSHDDFRYDVTISYLPDKPGDKEVGQEIQDFLTGEQMKVHIPDHESGSNFQLPSAKWHIFVLSKETVYKLNHIKTLCFGALYQSFDDNQLRVLPVVVGIQPEVVPRVIKSVTVVKASEPNYCHKLLTTMKGGNIRLEQTLPAGDVATGLAWAYVINYLKITLMKKSPDGLDLVGRIQQCLKNNSLSCGFIYKMFVIISKSCDVETDFIVKANEKPKSNDGGPFEVEKVGKLSPVLENTGGQQDRPFYLHMYKYTDLERQQSKCFIAEYSTPHKCLHEMAHRYPFAGLKPDDICVQAKRIVELVPQILQNETVKEKYGDMTELVEFVYYDDEKESLIEALRRHFQNQPQIDVDDASHHSKY